MLQLFKKKNKEKLPARLRGNSCLNCNVTLEGEEKYCPECGQRNNVNQLNFKLVLDEFFGDIFEYDSRLWRTVVPLILKPGKVAYEFILGKRKHFVNPFRTYLTASLIFFLIYGLLNTINLYNGDGTKTLINFNNNDNDSISKSEKDSIMNKAFAQAKKEIPAELDSILKAKNVNLDSINTDKVLVDSLKNKLTEQNAFGKKLQAFYNHYEKNKEDPIEQALDTLGYENTFWNQFYYDKAASVNKIIEDKGEGISSKIISGLSITIFLFLPVFAIFLKLLYIRRKYTYMEHLIFVFYTQTVFFLLFLLFVIIEFFVKDKSGSMGFISVLLFAIYLLLAMKRFYNQGWFKTFFKFLLANFSFLILSTIGLSILAIVSFILY
jgi:hypothetical protein